MEVSLFNSREEWREMIKLIANEEIDMISVSTYDFQEKVFDTDLNMSQLTRQATDLPLMICGQIHDRQSAGEALRDADIALSAKSFLLNPNWVEDVRAGKKLPRHQSAEADIAYTDKPLD
jgi:2,4-dienoyl-CoA reductase-like NADH-dependent reductase (Old Yellow Enzyme family)